MQYEQYEQYAFVSVHLQVNMTKNTYIHFVHYGLLVLLFCVDKKLRKKEGVCLDYLIIILFFNLMRCHKLNNSMLLYF